MNDNLFDTINMFKGIKQVDGTRPDFSESDFENGYLYLVRTSEEKDCGYIYLNGKHYGTSVIKDGTITTDMLKDKAVTADKIDDGAIVMSKLSQDVANYLLTDEMIEYLNDAIYTKLQDEAEELFTGTTIKSGTTTYIYGIDNPHASRVTALVVLKFGTCVVTTNYTPDGWTLENNMYSRTMFLPNPESYIEPALFQYTIDEGRYKGHTVQYMSERASLEPIYPVFYGFVPSNNKDFVNQSLIGSLTWSGEDIKNPSARLENHSGQDGYFCIITKNYASATQLSISILEEEVDAPLFYSPYNNASMEGYKVYYSKHKISAGKSLGNVNLEILV